MRRSMVVVILGVVLVVVACGGSDTRLTREEFLKQGNAICGTVKNVGIGSGDGRAPDAAEIKKYVKETLVPQTTKALNDLDALRPPNDLQSAIDSMISHARTVVATLDKQADTDPTAILDHDPFAEVNKEAGKIGLSVCAGSGT